MKFIKMQITITAAAIVAIACIAHHAEAQPIDIYDELNYDKFYQRVADIIEAAVGVSDQGASGRPISQRDEDRCKMPLRKGVCRALIPRWSYDPETKECLEFKFGGCDGNANNFPTQKQCLETCKDR